MSDETRDFARELARDLTPVERIARLRVALLRSLALWGLVTCAALLLQGLASRVSAPAHLLGGFGAVLSGLALVGLGSLVAALAAAVPGREASARAGAGLAASGGVLALGVGAWLLAGDPSARGPANPVSDVTCFVMACVWALLPALAALFFVARAAPRRPAVVLTAVGLGAVALGAFTAQLGCQDTAMRHLLLSHGLAPVLGAVVLLAPLWLGFRRLHVGRHPFKDGV